MVEDFHFRSLRERITPAILHIRAGWPILHAVVRIRPQNVAQALASLEDKWHKIEPSNPFRYSCLNDDLDRQYLAEQRLGRIVRYTSVFAVVIACPGLFGLASLVIVSQAKEIGIHKILRASASRIVAGLSWSFLRLVAMANIIAWPIAYFFMNRWLQDFAYRVHISVDVFSWLALQLLQLQSSLSVSTHLSRHLQIPWMHCGMNSRLGFVLTMRGMTCS